MRMVLLLLCVVTLGGCQREKRELRLGHQESIPLRIRASLVATLQRSAGKAWPIEIIG